MLAARPPPSRPLHKCPQLTQCLPPHPPCAGSTLNHWPFPWKHLPEGYCYLLTHPGTPCVFYDHLYSDAALKTHILELMKIRKKHGINAKSEVGAARWGRAGAVGGRHSKQQLPVRQQRQWLASFRTADARCLPAACYRPSACSAAACRFWCARPTTSCMRLSLTRRWP